MPTGTTPAELMNAEALYHDLTQKLESWRGATTQWVGIASGGAWMAKRLQHDWGLDQVGIISSSMHRDDYLKRGTSKSDSAAASHASIDFSTDLSFDVNGAHIVLLDDVLYTGRTIRAVLNELFDYGRPASVRLAVLLDRGGRQLPIHAEYAAQTVTLPSSASVTLQQDANGKFSFETKIKETTSTI